MSRLRKSLLAAAICVIVVIVAAVSAAAYTARSSFCISCHEMQPYYESWEHSDHLDTDCVECHIPKGFLNYVKTKAFAFREVYVHVRGEVKVPLAVTRDIPATNCVECHPGLGKSVVADATFNHATHRQRCIDCHVRLVHRTLSPPDYADPATMDACFACHDGQTASGACEYCHEPPHAAMGACTDCHGLEDWTPRDFEHPFPLEGAHAEVRCTDCHEERVDADGSRSLSIPEAECASCHEPPHAQMGPCEDCHAPTDWTPSKFQHPLALEGAHASLACDECHRATTGADGSPVLGEAPQACSACHKSPHGGPDDCGRCHSPAGWEPAHFSHPGVGEHIPGGEHRLTCSRCHPSGYGAASCSPCHSGGGGGDD